MTQCNNTKEFNSFLRHICRLYRVIRNHDEISEVIISDEDAYFPSVQFTSTHSIAEECIYQQVRNYRKTDLYPEMKRLNSQSIISPFKTSFADHFRKTSPWYGNRHLHKYFCSHLEIVMKKHAIHRSSR
jgi:hypothetical protein